MSFNHVHNSNIHIIAGSLERGELSHIFIVVNTEPRKKNPLMRKYSRFMSAEIFIAVLCNVVILSTFFHSKIMAGHGVKGSEGGVFTLSNQGI